MRRTRTTFNIVHLKTGDMKIYIVCIALFASAAAELVDPRGARPVVPNTRSEKCATEKEWPFCTDDQWGPKCPSGCRIHGLLERYDHGFLKRIEKIRSLLKQNQGKHHVTDQNSKQTYNILREKLILDSGNDNNYYDMSQTLRQRITDLKIRIDENLQVLNTLKDRVKDQVVNLKKLEVDIDIKLRTCKGSCKKYNIYEVNHEEYVALDKQINQLDSLSSQNIQTVGTLSVMKSRPLKDAIVDSVFKSKGIQTTQQKTEDLFPEVKTMQLFLEVEGSSSSPATISKVPVCLRLRQNQNGLHSLSHSDRKQKHCGRKSNFALCSDEDWVSRCPSGCRLHGLILENEKTVENKLRAICKTASTYKDAAEKSMDMTAQIYHKNRESIINASMLQVKFVENAERLATNLTSLQKRSVKLTQQMKELSEKVQKQMEELLRKEVDVDMRLRSCRGSCDSVLPFTVNLQDYESSLTQLKQTDQTKRKSRLPNPESILQIRLIPSDFGPEPCPVYKTIKTVQTEGLNLFEDVPLHHVVLEEASELE